jgi:hypothetical protein
MRLMANDETPVVTVGDLLAEAKAAESEPDNIPIVGDVDEPDEEESTPVVTAEPAVEDDLEEEEKPDDVSRETFSRTPAEAYTYPDYDTEVQHQATKRISLVNGILNDIRTGEPDLPKHILDQMESELIDGMDQADGTRRPFTLDELDSMRKTKAAVTQASGIVRQLQLQGKLKVRKDPPPPVEKAPRNRTETQTPKRELSASGSRLAERIASANGLDKEVFTK